MSSNPSETKRVLLVGHCGPDSSYLRQAVKSAIPGVQLSTADDDRALASALGSGVDLILFNRELGFGFDPDMGVEMIRQLRPKFPNTAMMLVSNYPDAQAAALAAGAVSGFGKREIGSAKVVKLLRDAIGVEAKA